MHTSSSQLIALDSIRCCPKTGRRRVAILGATGSIGASALDVISAMPSKLEAFGLAAHRSLAPLLELAAKHRCRVVAWAGDSSPCPTSQSPLSKAEREGVAEAREPGTLESHPSLPPVYGGDGGGQLTSGAFVFTGPDAVERLARHDDVDIVLSAIVGAAGLRGSWAALEAGKTLALANKETLVVAGPLVMQLAAQRRAALLPVDSEHSAVFQIVADRGLDAVERIVLTASGGPFRGYTRQQLVDVSVEQALRHPTWKMGAKITIDSATLMNKALEIIEARWLFGLDPEQIQVVIHPESIVHSFVEFRDGSVLAQLSPPDMRLPIQYALTYPERLEGPARRLDWSDLRSLHFEPPDRSIWTALDLGYEAARRGGTAGAALNAANEAAVARFLAGTLGFPDIVSATREVVAAHPFQAEPTLEGLLAVDRWARQEIERWP